MLVGDQASCFQSLSCAKLSQSSPCTTSIVYKSDSILLSPDLTLGNRANKIRIFKLLIQAWLKGKWEMRSNVFYHHIWLPAMDLLIEGEIFYERYQFLSDWRRNTVILIDFTHQTSHPFDNCQMTRLCSQCANNEEISGPILFTAELSQLDTICIPAEVLTEDSSPENAAICLHL